MSIQVFLKELTANVYQLLKNKERELSGAEVHLFENIDSITKEAIGGTVMFQLLADNAKYLRVISTLAFLSENGVDKPKFKRDIFKALRFLNDISKEVGTDG